MIYTGIEDFFTTKESIDIFIIIVFIILLMLSIISLIREPLAKLKKRKCDQCVFIPESEETIFHEVLNLNNDSKIEKIRMDLERTNVLYETIQTTDDKELFFFALNEICQILYSLIEYEKEVPFDVSPSERLKRLNSKRNDLINALENRIRIANLDLNEFAKECNDYVNMRDKYDFDNMNGHEFEYFCADILKKNNFINVEVTQGSGDHGIDILAEKDDITYAIQCKCYSKDIGNAAV